MQPASLPVRFAPISLPLLEPRSSKSNFRVLVISPARLALIQSLIKEGWGLLSRSELRQMFDHFEVTRRGCERRLSTACAGGDEVAHQKHPFSLGPLTARDRERRSEKSISSVWASSSEKSRH